MHHLHPTVARVEPFNVKHIDDFHRRGQHFHNGYVSIRKVEKQKTDGLHGKDRYTVTWS